MIASEVDRRRTFAIISHPDAGKTTITEKLLLLGKAIQFSTPHLLRGKERGEHLNPHTITNGTFTVGQPTLSSTLSPS